MRQGINQTLYDWLINHPDGMAIQSALRQPTFTSSVQTFFSSTTDAQRLVAAEKCAAFPLVRNDLSDMAKIRKDVRTLELSRKIAYPKQTDHSAHSVYVYLLGLFLLSSSTHLKNHSPKTYSAVPGFSFQSFLFPWIYNSLLHDIGYAFSEPPLIVPSSRSTLERLFHEQKLCELLAPTNTHLQSDFEQFKIFLTQTLHNANLQLPVYVSHAYPEHALDALRRIPWGPQIGIPNDAFDAFVKFGNLPQNLISELESYAYYVAESGYDGQSEGTVDHAIASALFLVQWTSYYYWLADKTRSHKNNDWLEKYFMRYQQDRTKEPFTYSYQLSNLTNDIIPAVCSVAFHNIMPVSRNFSILPFELNKHPLIYISVLSDELQKWDRFPSGSKWLRDLDSFAEISPSSEDVLVNATSQPISFSFPNHSKTAGDIIKALDDKLINWNQIVTIS